ncbi:MAG: hypothetical protein MPK62_00865 [Alphaproteobacteria bacterium]|nr:hypothetical protein [Alphaproteobacteria bacterium]MDA8029685.1 hypothetical protein [Alphaproteobacteria bacterium]
MRDTAWAVIGDREIAHIVGLEQKYGPTFVVCGAENGIYGKPVYDADAERCPDCEEAVE